jgi:hypothetical protein
MRSRTEAGSDGAGAAVVRAEETLRGMVHLPSARPDRRIGRAMICGRAGQEPVQVFTPLAHNLSLAQQAVHGTQELDMG